MPRVELDQDVYDHLLRNTREIGEGASSILRRLLELPQPEQEPQAYTDSLKVERSPRGPKGVEALIAFVSAPEYRSQRNVTEQFLVLLGFLHQQHNTEFDKLLALRGRRRRYFGSSEADIRQSGRSTFPRQIPDSNYWVLTNADNHHKREIVGRALQQLGYSADVRSNVARSLG